MLSVSACVRISALVGLYALDLLDLYAKVSWLGPTESFSFEDRYERSFAHEPLPKPAFLTASNSSSNLADLDTELVASGWASYYYKCSELYATKDAPFRMVKATNCDLGMPSAPDEHQASELVLSASVRVDSVAWMSCQLLFSHRRPPICQENVVTLFPQRYLLTETELRPEQMAPINSQAEAELWRMLDLLSRSHPLSGVVCSQGFQSTAGPGHYEASIFLCGSPSLFESAAVGAYATSFAETHHGFSWLEVNKLDLFGFEFVSRQSARSAFQLRERDGELVVSETRATNFASFGHLYVVLVVLDAVLLLENVRAALETLTTFDFDSLVDCNLAIDGVSSDHCRTNWFAVYRPLYRSSRMLFLQTLSSVLSWLMNVSYAVVWSRNCGRVLPLLFLLRVWMLVLCVTNVLWGAFVWVAEAQAYYVTQRTFLTALDILVATAIVVGLESGDVFAAFGDTPLRGQRLVDDRAFNGHVAVSNAYDDSLDGFSTTPFHEWAALLHPLAVVVAETLALLAAILVAKLLYYRRRRRSGGSTSMAAVQSVECETASDQQFSSAPLLALDRTKVYHRLPLEELMGAPVRANSLVRAFLAMEEIADDGHIYLLPYLYYDFGLVVSTAGLLLTRRGFSSVIRRRLDVERFFAPAEPTASVCPSPLKRQKVGDRLAPSKSAFVLEGVPSLADAIATDKGSPSPPRIRPDARLSPMARSMRRRKSMEDLLDTSSKL